jgi:hypothetical protein
MAKHGNHSYVRRYLRSLLSPFLGPGLPPRVPGTLTSSVRLGFKQTASTGESPSTTATAQELPTTSGVGYPARKATGELAHIETGMGDARTLGQIGADRDSWMGCSSPALTNKPLPALLGLTAGLGYRQRKRVLAHEMKIEGSPSPQPLPDKSYGLVGVFEKLAYDGGKMTKR